jgi:hypothetical protein
MFGRFLGLGSFDSPKELLAHKQAYLPITFGGVRSISTSTIALIAYLGSWALIALIITIRFMVDQHPFFFKTLTRVDNNTFPLQHHFKVACDLLPPPTHACFPAFE